MKIQKISTNFLLTCLKVSEQEAGDENKVGGPVSASSSEARPRREEPVELEALGHEDALKVNKLSWTQV